MKDECQRPNSKPSYAHRKGCRCIRCNEWNTAKQNALRRRSVLRVAIEQTSEGECCFPNNTASTAYQYGCRCKRCVTEQTARCRRTRERKREK